MYRYTFDDDNESLFTVLVMIGADANIRWLACSGSKIIDRSDVSLTICQRICSNYNTIFQINLNIDFKLNKILYDLKVIISNVMIPFEGKGFASNSIVMSMSFHFTASNIT